MAMMKCKYCGSAVSSRAISCPVCGKVLMGDYYESLLQESKVCEECGRTIPGSSSRCPHCGCPIIMFEDEKHTSVKKVNSPASIPQKSGKTLFILLVLLFVVLASILMVTRITFRKNLVLVADKMIDGASQAENTCQLIANVWHNAIWEVSSEETDPYTKEGDEFVNDFNDALKNLMNDYQFQINTTAILNNQYEVITLMKKLRHPPIGMKKAYDSLLEMYDAYYKLTMLAVNPTGSLETFSNDYLEADNLFLRNYYNLAIYTG